MTSDNLVRDIHKVPFSKSKTKRLLAEFLDQERVRIYAYTEERLIGVDNDLLKDLSNIIFDRR